MTASSLRVLQMRLVVEAVDDEEADGFPQRPRRVWELAVHGMTVSR